MTSFASTSHQAIAEISGYTVVEQLYLGSRTVVYRAVQAANQQSVVIKVLRREYPSFSELVQFCNQYTITKNLSIPGIVHPLSLEPLGKGYALVMEDWGGVALGQYVQQHSLELSEALAIAIQLADILHDLSQHRVVHKDIKPANILIHPETKQVKLIDFSIASLLPKETQEIQNPSVLEGTLAYLSPEQTGRMNRGIDYRSDFYSLGVTLFELLTGQLPFQSSEPMELLHCHLAKHPPSVCDINPDLPLMLGEIIHKLMAKSAEDRYQSATGLKHDLIQCQQLPHRQSRFKLGQQDICDRFLIPEKLYGREQEITTLLHAFSRVANGAAELMLVAGFSGIGKTAVVNEVHKPIVRWNGYFIKGKYDQFNRNIPFSAVVQALRDLMGQLLSESDEQLVQWKQRILSVVGENGQVLIDVIPELEHIIGAQSPVTELAGSAAQSRFNRLFQAFIAVFATPEHPLVMFLDDLQWADSASLNLIQVLMTEKTSGYLMLIGAYRDNEVSPTHPLMLVLEDIHKTRANVHTLTLAPLSQSDVNRLIADAFSCRPHLALPFTELVCQKTGGNPFFITQFLKALHEDGLIMFDWEVGAWQCDLANVRSQALTEDVVEFMAFQLQKLPSESQTVLKLAACVGNQFDLATLAIVSEQSELETASALWKALQEGFVIPTNEVYKFYQNSAVVNHPSTSTAQFIDKSSELNVSYKFLHDRVQQAAYSLIPDSQKTAAHLKIGRLLLSNTSSEVLETKIFDIVNQLHNGLDLITQQSEKDEIANLYLMAGKKAKASTAYKAAVDYFEAGIKLLAENSWTTHYNLTFSLYREGAECDYLIGHLQQAEQGFNLALSHAQTAFEKADIYAICMYLKMTQGEDIQASFEDGLKGLSMLGMELPRTVAEQQAEIQVQVDQIQTKLATTHPSDLINLPTMIEQKHKLFMSLLADLWAATYMGGDQHLAHLSLLLMINTSLTHGNAEASGFAYCLYGMSLANQGDYNTAYEFGVLALKLDHYFNSTKFIYKTNNIFAHTINPYNQHLKTNLAISRQAFQASQAGGDVVFGVWAVSFLIWAMIIKGDCLADVYAETEKYWGYVQQVNDANMLYAFMLQRQFLLTLQDSTHHTDLLDQQNDNYQYDNEYEPSHIQVWRHKKNFEHGINWYCFLKLKLSYLYGRYADAIAAAQEAEATLPCNAGFFPIILYHFYYPLSVAALYATATAAEQSDYWQVLQHHQQILKNWAEFCPDNFLHKYLLLSAEMAAIAGNTFEAVDLYDRAIAAANTYEYLQEEALANELAAKFFLNWGKPLVAQDYLIKAYYGYASWGAKTKVADLEIRYPQLLAPILRQEPSPLSISETVFAHGPIVSTGASSSGFSDVLDLAAVLKTSQAISGEIELKKLLSSLLSIIIENAGADKCVLMLLRGEQLLIKGAITLGTEPVVLQRIPVEDSQDVPLKLIYKVMHQQQTMVLINAVADPTLASDPYIMRQQPKSVLCSPILHQGKLKGILYVENNLATGAFTSDRVELLNLLCAQAAISLENARLYEQSQQYAQQLEVTLNELQDSKTRFQNLAANIPGMIYQFCLAVDGSTSTPYVSSGCFDLYELEPDAVMTGRHSLYAMHHPEDHAATEQAMTNSAQTLTPFIHEWRIITPSGIVKWVQSAARPERKPDGSIVWDGVLIDVSDRKQAEAIIVQKSQALEQALYDLQHAQLQVVQNEKMATLGNLVAGVAHEINNPVGFLNGSINNAKDYIQDLFGYLDTYQQHQPPHQPVQDYAEDIELEFLYEDLPKLIHSMAGATERIKSISNSLRTFSRADTEYKVQADVHEGIDSTILILKYRLKANEFRPEIEVLREYGDLPLISCFPGQLNQVFMNILANAIDVFDETAQHTSLNDLKANPQVITIKTQLVEQNAVAVHIRDNGSGMTAEVKERIFDHLFTTKAVGKGTGLGLAIARQIVEEKHGGRLEVRSEPGQGTEFCIWLPR